MKPKYDVNRDILFMTMKIENEYPEISKNLSETPIHTTKEYSNGIDENSLKDYCNSLEELVRGFTKTIN